MSCDAWQMTGASRGGDDAVMGGDNFGSGLVLNHIAGEAISLQGMFDDSVGGDDVLTGGNNHGAGEMRNLIVGDGFDMAHRARGGDDVLTGGDNIGAGANMVNELFGDAHTLSDSTRGGDDTLIAGQNKGSVRNVFSNKLMGDAEVMNGQARGGNDRLVSGEGTNDDMYGDAWFMTEDAVGGADRFVFIGDFGADAIWDFRKSDGDIIRFRVEGADAFEDLRIERVKQDVVITVEDSDAGSVTLENYAADEGPRLTESDFQFA